MKKNFLFISLVCLTLVGCSKSTKSTDLYSLITMADTISLDEYENVIHAKIQYCDFNRIDNLSDFFDEIDKLHPLPYWDEDDHTKEKAFECVRLIEAYRRGDSKYFPDLKVRGCIDLMGATLAAICNHSDSIDLFFSEWFMMCAAFYSPDITCLVEAQTPDHCAGYINWGQTYNPGPWWAYGFFKRENGFEVIRLCDYELVERVFELYDDHNHKYYLFSNNSLDFHQYLFWEQSDGEFLKVAECSNENAIEGANCYYFNSEKMVWKYAYLSPDRTKLDAVGDKFAMKLDLDGVNSKFVKD